MDDDDDAFKQNPYLVNGQFVRIPLRDAFRALVHDGHRDIRTFECHDGASGTANVTSPNTTDAHH